MTRDEILIKRKELEDMLKYEVMCEFLLKEKNNLDLSKFSDFIDDAIEYFKKKEMFEKCAILKNLVV